MGTAGGTALAVGQQDSAAGGALQPWSFPGHKDQERH